MRIDTVTDRARAISVASAAIRRGDLVVIPTESMYAIATDAFSQRGTSALRALKKTPAGVPLPVMIPSPATLPGIAHGISSDAQALIDGFWPGPLTLILRSQPTLSWDIGSADSISVRMPLHPIALEVLKATGPTVVTGANLPGMPVCRNCDDAEDALDETVDVFLDAGELAAAQPASSVVDVTGEVPVLLRAGGFTLEMLREVSPNLRDGTLGEAEEIAPVK